MGRALEDRRPRAAGGSASRTTRRWFPC